MITVRPMKRNRFDEVRRVEDGVTQDYSHSRLLIELKENSEQRCTLLAFLCKEDAAACARSAEDGNGLHAWQALLTAKTLRILLSLMSPL